MCRIFFEEYSQELTAEANGKDWPKEENTSDMFVTGVLINTRGSSRVGIVLKYCSELGLE